ncbi:hypothetical protein V5O48_011475 [Marasmius crinis-equi]|uniref:Uncharacterized protein n=1 Tax=Marasmius crinis-equi TaxID=585013 RepID=A0ABR3F5H8_9AGAR
MDDRTSNLQKAVHDNALRGINAIIAFNARLISDIETEKSELKQKLITAAQRITELTSREEEREKIVRDLTKTVEDLKKQNETEKSQLLSKITDLHQEYQENLRLTEDAASTREHKLEAEIARYRQELEAEKQKAREEAKETIQAELKNCIDKLFRPEEQEDGPRGHGNKRPRKTGIRYPAEQYEMHDPKVERTVLGAAHAHASSSSGTAAETPCPSRKRKSGVKPPNTSDEGQRGYTAASNRASPQVPFLSLKREVLY